MKINRTVIPSPENSPVCNCWINALYAIFSNPIGMDDNQLKNGCSMILDPYGDVLAEGRSFKDDFVAATLSADKLTLAGGYRYIKARRPELYKEIIGKTHDSDQKLSWREGPTHTS